MNPGDHRFCFLNVSINKKPFFISAVVTIKKLVLALVALFRVPIIPNQVRVGGPLGLHPCITHKFAVIRILKLN